MNDSRYQPFPDRPLSRSSMARSDSSPTFDSYDQRRSSTPDRYLSPDDRRAGWALRNNYEDSRHAPFSRDHQLVTSPGKHHREAWRPHFSHQSSHSDPDVGWLGDGFYIEDERYYRDERRREVHEWEHTAGPRIPRSGVQYVRRGNVERRYPHIAGFRAECAIDGELRERRCAGFGSWCWCGVGGDWYISGLGDREDMEVELARRRYLDGYTIRWRRCLR
ncbi:hypothetical protein B9Z19DRAFT_1064316 [Tuber borchii]|uniref:Uncharacterized protein n=1 Tax=Tuber borchii TaxID=42251 RepID=A0A2T6ZV28_TUBBO|nr:hypothetical protein B9Z19DRAFT_1064316 [Tuber borchii]